MIKALQGFIGYLIVTVLLRGEAQESRVNAIVGLSKN